MKIVAGTLLTVLIVLSDMLPRSEADWWSDTWNKIADSATDIVINSLINKNKRDVKANLLTTGLDKSECASMGITKDVKFNQQMTTDAFQKADVNKDGVLQEAEAITYESLLLIMNNCLNEQNTDETSSK